MGFLDDIKGKAEEIFDSAKDRLDVNDDGAVSTEDASQAFGDIKDKLTGGGDAPAEAAADAASAAADSANEAAAAASGAAESAAASASEAAESATATAESALAGVQSAAEPIAPGQA